MMVGAVTASFHPTYYILEMLSGFPSGKELISLTGGLDNLLSLQSMTIVSF